MQQSPEVKDVRRKLMGMALAAALGKLSPGDLSKGKSLARRIVGSTESGVVGYTLITAKKE